MRLPPEIIVEIAYCILTTDPYASLSLILPLLTVSKGIYQLLALKSNHNFYARIYRLKFDHSAIARRAFKPLAIDYAEQLVHYWRILKVIKTGVIANLDDAWDVLAHACLMMLDNNGKNRSQLEHVNIDRYVRQYVLHHLSGTSWPEDSPVNASALWLMWMFSTKEKLLAETISEREQIVRIVLPYVVLPYRYASAAVPPNHFHLPLPPDSSTATIEIPHGSYPIYQSGARTLAIHYRSRIPFIPPSITASAKLLYFSRREIVPLGIPPHLPATRAEAIARNIIHVAPTQEDMREVNENPSAGFVARVVWDWDRGRRVTWRSGVEINEGDAGLEEESVKWDCDWWRQLLCENASRSRPRWLPGRVYQPGSLSGLWQGRIIIPSDFTAQFLLNTPVFPGPAFQENSLQLTVQPLFIRLKEHHCIVPSAHIPGPSFETVELADGPLHIELGIKNAWLPGAAGSLNCSRVYDPAAKTNDREKVRVTLGNAPQEGWIYETYDKTRKGMHAGPEGGCGNCVERENMLLALRREREYEIEKAFESVGLGRNDDEDEEVTDFDVEDNEEEEEEEDPEDLHFIEMDSPIHSGESKEWRRCEVIAPCDGVTDVLLTGETDHRHALAWNKFEFYGRVRVWDGLIGILRMRRGPDPYYIFFYGYLNGNNNFVGNWRHTVFSANPLEPAWESAFVMTKREE